MLAIQQAYVSSYIHKAKADVELGRLFNEQF